jgi:ribonuclease HI
LIDIKKIVVLFLISFYAYIIVPILMLFFDFLKKIILPIKLLQINFWLDKWMPNGQTLMNFSTQQTIDTTLTVKDTLTESGDWDVNFLTIHLLDGIVKNLVAIPAPKDTDGPDFIGWSGTNTRYFTVQSAYNLQRESNLPIEGNWKSLWSWKGPHRIQTFMWIAAHERLLTNYRRSRWGSGISPTCPACGNADETVIHVLRDCVQATQIWFRLVASNHITNFFSLNCRDWIFNNLDIKMTGANKNEWQNIFMVTCWHLWTWRNKRIFEEGFQRPNTPIQVILKMAMEIGGCKQTHWIGLPQRIDTIYIGWKCPREGWIKLNCDGAHKSSINLSGCGGLLRNSNGTFLKGYARKIGSCDALHAEMWGMYIGMDLARRQGITHLQVESDSKVLVDMVTGNCNANGNVPTLIRRIRDLKNMNWQVQINHTWREGNRSADWLANFSFNFNSFDLHVMESWRPLLESSKVSFFMTFQTLACLGIFV